MLNGIKRLALDPSPVRSLALRLARRLDIGSFQFRLDHGLLERPNYAYIVYEGAVLAKRLGLKKISVLEFGVAGGNGLAALERLTGLIGAEVGMEIEIYGFDTGQGLPAPIDFRDLPYHWKEGFFKMDVPALKARLTKAELVLGDIRDTAQTFFETCNPAPIAAISHDFDYYSSTAAALKMFDAAPNYFLPRVFCYFDDTIGGRTELYNDYTGQRGAIADFNAEHDSKKLCVPHYLLARPLQEAWYRQIFIYHDFTHPDYCKFMSGDDQQLHLKR